MMKYKTLNECCKQITDYVASGSFASLKANVKITNEPDYAIMVKTADFSNNFSKDLTYTDKHGYDFLRNSNLFGGELILSNIGSIGKVFIVPKLDMPMTLASNTIMVRPNDNFLTKYMYYFFLSPNGQGQLDKISSATSMRKFNKTQLKSTIIPVYSKDKQEEIVLILDKINTIIEEDKKQLELLDELIKSRFNEMFSDLKQSVRLGDCCEVHARIGWQALTTAEHMKTGDYMLITGTDFKDKEVNYSTCKYVTKERYEMDEHIILRNNDVLITKDGTIGKVAIVHNLPKPATLNAGVFVVRPDNRFDKEYISYVFKGPLFEEFVEKSKTGATIKHLNQKHLVEFNIPLPNLSLQKEFAIFSNLIDNSKVNIQRHIVLMQEMFDKKMDEYFGGND